MKDEEGEIIEPQNPQENNNIPPAEPPADNLPPTPPADNEPPVDVPPTAEIDDEKVFQYLKTKRPELETLEDVFKEKVVEKVVNPFEKIQFSESDDMYLNWKAENPTGSIQEFVAFSTDYSGMSEIDLALAKVRADFPSYSDEDRRAFIEVELGIDLSEDLTSPEKMKLAKYAQSFVAEKLAEQEKYKKPFERVSAETKTNPLEDFIDLGNGSFVSKEAQEKWLKDRQAYEESVKNPVNRVAEEKLTFEFDNNGTKEVADITYSFSEEGLRRAESNALKLEEYQQARYRNSDGSMNTALLKRDLYILDNFQEIVKLSNDKVSAFMVENFTKWANNPNFKRENLPTENQNGERVMPFSELFSKIKPN